MYNDPNQKRIRKRLRNNPSPPEVLLWAKLKGKALGVKFRRQYSIGKYVVDFYCPSRRLVIEIDGEHHFADQLQIDRDRERQHFIEQQNIVVIRFTGKEVNENMEGVLASIHDSLK